MNPMIELDDIKGVMTDMVEIITHGIVERGEDVCPVAFIFKTSGKLEIAGLDFPDMETKKRMLATMGKASKLPGVRAVGLLTDSYTKTIKDDEELAAINRQGGLEASQDAEECIALTIMERDRIVAHGSQRYARIMLPDEAAGGVLVCRIRWHRWEWHDSAERRF